MRIPRATYRLQLNADFNFSDAGKIVEYLCTLGVSDIYASPILKAKNGCTHGYDVVDHSLIDPQLGGLEGFEQLIKLSRAQGLGWIQDIVPNHMSYSHENKILMDVFENGPLSPFAQYFDFDFNHPYENLKNKILAPFLGEFYGNCLENNQIQIVYTEKGFRVIYMDLELPLRIDSYFTILMHNLPSLADRFGADKEHLLKFMEVTQWLKDFSSIADHVERSRQSVLIKSWLWRLYSEDERIKNYIDGHLKAINTKTAASPLMDDMDRLLGEQYYRLAFWKVGNEELNYRRFFTVNNLICLRMEDHNAFEDAHRLVFQLIQEGKITGLRIDHFDGLYDPLQYLKDLKSRVPDVYTVAEKILAFDEHLPADFEAQGTTGYDFMNFVNGLFVDPAGEKKINQGFIAFTKMASSFEMLVSDKKKLFIGKYMAGDIDNLAQLLKILLNHNRNGRDLTLYGLKRALVEIMAQFPVYRTYANSQVVRDTDAVYFKKSLAAARRNNPGAAYELDAIEKVFLLKFDHDVQTEEKEEWLRFIQRFQQFTGPLMAKGAEDTAFYIYNRLVSLNEVGGNPSVFGISVRRFHEFNTHRAEHWAHTLNATSTHDTKRGEDARCRIDILSEIPREWNQMVRVWSRLNHSKRITERGAIPDRDDEYFIYQTLIGAFPPDGRVSDEFIRRLEEYVIKAIREAKLHTAWIKPDEVYENGCVDFVRNIFKDDPDNGFLKSFLPFQQKIARAGALNSLSQVLLKSTSPGVPDFYQGSEFWDLSFVDPDNRRPVDYAERIECLKEIRLRENDSIPLLSELWNTHEDGRIKLFVMHRVLSLRDTLNELFEHGRYIPLEVQGILNDRLVAFAREWKGDWVMTIVPRLISKDTEFLSKPLLWQDTAIVLPPELPSVWEDVLTRKKFSGDRCLAAEKLFESFPMVLLVGDRPEG